VTAKAKPATAINLSIVFLLFFLPPKMDQYHCSAERWMNEPLSAPDLG
jgi:hypothetical protein